MSKTSRTSSHTGPEGSPSERSQKPLTPQAKRALAEAEARRTAQENKNSGQKDAETKELGGRKGPDPVRFGDWENGGIVSDF